MENENYIVDYSESTGLTKNKNFKCLEKAINFLLEKTDTYFEFEGYEESKIKIPVLLKDNEKEIWNIDKGCWEDNERNKRFFKK